MSLCIAVIFPLHRGYACMRYKYVAANCSSFHGLIDNLLADYQTEEAPLHNDSSKIDLQIDVTIKTLQEIVSSSLYSFLVIMLMGSMQTFLPLNITTRYNSNCQKKISFVITMRL